MNGERIVYIILAVVLILVIMASVLGWGASQPVNETISVREHSARPGVTATDAAIVGMAASRYRSHFVGGGLHGGK